MSVKKGLFYAKRVSGEITGDFLEGVLYNKKRNIRGIIE
jgi:hypothetical protein